MGLGSYEVVQHAAYNLGTSHVRMKSLNNSDGVSFLLIRTQGVEVVYELAWLGRATYRGNGIVVVDGQYTLSLVPSA